MSDALELARDLKYEMRKLLEKLEEKNKNQPTASTSQEEKLAVV